MDQQQEAVNIHIISNHLIQDFRASKLTPLESLNNIAACVGSMKPSEFFLELDIVPRDNRRVSGSRELLRNRAPNSNRKKSIHYALYLKKQKLQKT